MIKKHDFIEIDYTGRITGTNQIFDLTEEKLAKENNINNPKAKYGPRIICVGENSIVKGLDLFLEGKEVKAYTIDLKPEQAFGSKNPDLIKIVPMSSFKDKNIKPFPGLQLNVDGFFAVVRSVSGGRIVLDFNHPLAGRDVNYEVKIKRIVTDDKEKLKALLENTFGTSVEFEFKSNTAHINLQLPDQIKEALTKKINEFIPNIKRIEFKPSEKQEGTKQKEKEAKEPKDKTSTRK